MDLPSVLRFMCEVGVDRNPATLSAVIRFVQRSEGSEECFGSAGGLCGHMGCAWRTCCSRSKDQAAPADPLAVSWPRLALPPAAGQVGPAPAATTSSR